MMILAAVAALFVLKKGTIATAVKSPSSTGNLTGNKSPVIVSDGSTKGIAGISTSIHKNATGVALSASLGNANRSPSYYKTGNPGTNGITLPPSSSIAFMKPRHTSTAFVPTVSNPTGGSKHVPYMGGQSGDFTRNDPPRGHRAITTSQTGQRKLTYSALVNPNQTARPIQGPEQPAPTWTNLPPKKRRKSA